MDIYQMPNGKWAVTFCGFVSDGFPSREEAIEWILQKVEELLAELILSAEGAIDTGSER